MTGESMLRLTVDQLARTLCASAVLGAPIEAGERVIIPVAEFGFGFGGGEGTGGHKEGVPHGGAASGAGGGITAVALIIITRGVSGPEGIQVVSLKKKSQMAEVISTIGETVGPHVEKVLEKGSEMMQQRMGGRTPGAEGKEIPVGGEEEA
ncbi:MAG: spore germination protein GerW family protein [Methanoculleus sp.]|nr:spore germination protein GerW family protein [Methanoculleus sp.]